MRYVLDHKREAIISQMKHRRKITKYVKRIPVVDKGVWRIRYNEELCKLMAGEDIVRFIKAQRIHEERMDETAMPKRVLKGKLYATRRIGRPRIGWLEDVIADLRRMGITGWMEKARNRDQWRRIVEKTKAHPGL
jgi:hypothetical protein